ncbi:MAG TPA: hypothetical protein VGC41_15540 [Kofleriaceae bacterium]
MAPKEKLSHSESEVEESDEREVYLRDGKKLVVGESNGNQLVEIRSESGQVEVRIELTPAGPVLKMESVKLELKAEQSIDIASKEVSIKAESVKIETEDSVEVDAKGEVRVAGKMIYLN